MARHPFSSIRPVFLHYVLSVLCLSLCLFFPSSVHAKSVYWIQLNDDTINPVTAEYITQAIDKAQEGDGQCLVIELDTPGGLLTSTREIVKKILAAKIPVVVYVAPNGSRAGSAGVFITYASNIAAMAPSANIGAAHPVRFGMGRSKKDGDSWEELKQLLQGAREDTDGSSVARDEGTATKDAGTEGQEESGEEGPGGSAGTVVTEDPDEDPLNTKILQDTAAFIRALAVKRNRNVDWAVKSVTKSYSITSAEALELGVIDLIAENADDLLARLNNREVAMEEGRVVVLKTAGIPVVRLAMTARQKFFNILANPNIAYILLLLGFYGLLYEVTHPGFGIPGIMGTIFIVLAFYTMQLLPVNYAGLALIIVGLALLVAEAFVPGFGVLTTGGVVSMFIGSLLLFDSPEPLMRVSLPVIFAMLGSTAAITIFLLNLALSTFRKKAISGQEGMCGALGTMKRAAGPGQEGKVFVHGELWNAVAVGPVNEGDKVVVREIHGLLLTVEKMKP